MDFFTADLHFQHRNIIKYANRPFVSVEEMDAMLIANFNERVRAKDTVYVLGDFCLGDQSRVDLLLGQLDGRLHLIWGNHDSDKVKSHARWESSGPYKEININREHIVLFHYGMRVWNRSHHGAYQLYGHSHAGLPPIARSMDVGVDQWDFKPVTFPEIKTALDQRGLLEHVTPHNHGSRE